jgi:hypothetical protein
LSGVCVCCIVQSAAMHPAHPQLSQSAGFNLFPPACSYYRQIQKGLIDCENMFELLARRPDVDDAAGAGDLAVTQGAIHFDNVTFRCTLLHFRSLRYSSQQAFPACLIHCFGDKASYAV